MRKSKEEPIRPCFSLRAFPAKSVEQLYTKKKAIPISHFLFHTRGVFLVLETIAVRFFRDFGSGLFRIEKKRRSGVFFSVPKKEEVC